MTREDFDRIVREAIGDQNLFGYAVLPNEDKTYHMYEMYYSNDEFNKFCNTMKSNYECIYDSYARGKGSELVGTPPKMASVASSSRFCYLSLRDASISDFDNAVESSGPFEFEKELLVRDITGTNPQMDAFTETDRFIFFFEFKCHELFDNHKKVLSSQYDKYFKKWGVSRNSEKIPLREFGIDTIKLFDLKQFITHIVGIINYPGNGKRKVFSYVYFKPVQADNKIYENLISEIRSIFNSDTVKKICEENEIELRLYFYENSIMEGFEKKKKPILCSF